MTLRLKLQFRTGHHRGQTLEFESPRTLVLGRSTQSDVQIYDGRISRRHCAIKLEGDRALIKDLGTVNGTLLNGGPIRESQLTHGDLLVLGGTEVEIQLIRERVDIPPTEPLQAVGPAEYCAICSKPVPADDLALANRHKGKPLCLTCSPPIEVPGYRLEKKLGEGAMGVVYMALNESTSKLVALKVLKARGEVDGETRARFAREVNTAAQLTHPNIVKVLDCGEVTPHLYYTMEFVPGKSLKAYIEQHGALPLPSVLRVSVQVAEALEHAREHNVVHRDVKPENIIVQNDGHAKLADFGLAKNVLSSGASGLTRPGDGLGTLPYMPPELIADAVYADHRCDVYSLGASIYHMLTGQTPFTAKTPVAFFRLIREETPKPITEFRKDVPYVLTRMIEKSMAKSPDDRYDTVADMAMIMRQFLQSEFDSRQTAS
ncbi:MAG: protein kinase [Planctomycetes bacterium]|nr:protein kinase [Planctomycetota bacterium]